MHSEAGSRRVSYISEHFPSLRHETGGPEVVAALLADEAVERDFRGWDPFDGLNSGLFKRLPLRRSRLARLAWLQLFKRSPINLRPLAGVPQVQNAKATSLTIRSLLLLDRDDDARQALGMLMAARCSGERWGAGAWGYPFDWQARAFLVERGTPNLICTAYGLRAIVAAGRRGLLSDDEVATVAQAAATFVEQHLAQEVSDGGLTIGYVPGSHAVVHNVGAWGAYVLSEGAALCGESRWRDMSLAAANTVVRAQDPAGFWVYGERDHHRFIDGFHIGYVLEALACIERRLGCRFDQAIDRGLADYRKAFFDECGRPYYFRDLPYPIDCHAAAQGALTLILVRESPEHTRQAATILDWTMQNMWNQRMGRFHYQKGRYLTNRIDYFRWTQAWMALALATLAQPDTARLLG